MSVTIRKAGVVVLTASGLLGALACGDVATGVGGFDAGEAPEPALEPVAEPVEAPETHRSVTAVRPEHQNEQVPGELIVKFKSDTEAGVTFDFAAALRERRAIANITADGSDSLDHWVGRFGVREATALVSRDGLSTDEAKAQLRKLSALPARWRAGAAGVVTPTLPGAGAANGTSGGAPGTLPSGAQGALSPFEGLVNVYLLRLAEGADLGAAMEELRNDPHVEYVHPNYVAHLNYTPNDPYFSSYGTYGQPRDDLWNIKKVRAPLAWDSTRGAGVVVAVLDTGVDIGHPDLAGNIWVNPGEIPGNGEDDDNNGLPDDVNGWSFDGNSADVSDRDGHGTHVAGIIAAQDNNGKGVVGVAPDVKIMPVQVFSSSAGSGVTSSAFTLARGLYYAAQKGADVINNSWKTCSNYCPSVPVVEDAVRTAYNAGAVVVFAAGNDNIDVRDLSPLNMPEAIVVSATTPTDVKASFSNWGLIDVAAPGAGNENDPNVTAPIAGILSLRSTTCQSSEACNATYQLPNGVPYSRLWGTSFAAPAVSGAAALIMALKPSYTQEQVRQVLRRTSTDVGTSGFDVGTGYGRLDVGAIASEQTPLTAFIRMPLRFTSNSVGIAGQAFGSQFANYTLHYGVGRNPTTWTQLYTSTTQQQSGLYSWNPSTLADGDYTIRLRATKTNGAVYEDRHIITLDRVGLASPAPFGTVSGNNVSIVGSAAPGDFQSYTLQVRRLDTGALVNGISLTNNGQAPVLNSTLGVWNTQGLAAGHYKVTLNVTRAGNKVTSESVAFVFDPLKHAGFPVQLPVQSFVTPTPFRALTVTDVNSSGPAEIVTGWGDQVFVYTGNGTTLSSGWPTSLNQKGYFKAAVVGDIDGDGQKEVVASTTLGWVFVWSASGASKPGWPKSFASESVDVTLGDVNRNGVLDVVVVEEFSKVHVFTGTGSNLPGWPVSIADVHGPARVADLNRDNTNEVIVGAGYSPIKLYVLGSTGLVQTGWPRNVASGGGDFPSGQPVIGDMDDDGDLEIVTVTSDGVNASNSYVHIWQHNGTVLRSWSPNALHVRPAVLADVDGDGSLEVLTTVINTNGSSSLQVRNGNGVSLSGWPKTAPQAPNGWTEFTSPIVADIDGDARNEVIVGRRTEFASTEFNEMFGFGVQVYSYNGSLLTSLNRPTFGSWSKPTMSPTLAEIDGDGKLELLWLDALEGEMGGDGFSTRHVRVHAWDLTASTSRAQSWTAERADARGSGLAQNVVPFQQLTQRNTTRQVSGLGRFVFRAGGAGKLQVKHPQGASVQYAVGTNLPQYTTQGWGQELNVPPNQDVKLRVITSSAVNVTIDWW